MPSAPDIDTDARYPISAVDTLSGFPYVITAMLSHWT